MDEIVFIRELRAAVEDAKLRNDFISARVLEAVADAAEAATGCVDIAPKPGDVARGVGSCPAQRILAAWNSMASNCGLPVARTLTNGRKKALRARWTDEYWRENWGQALRLVPKSDFLKGRNERGWRANFDWFLRPGTVAKLMEGHYAGTAGQVGDKLEKLMAQEKERESRARKLWKQGRRDEARKLAPHLFEDS